MTYTEMEIRGTFETLKEVLDYEFDFTRIKKIIDTAEKIIFLGCGSSYHLSTALSHFVKRYLKKDTYPLIGSETLLSFESNIVNPSNTVVFAFSRSGETTETIKSAEKLKNKGLPLISVTCTENSTLSILSDISITIPSKEKSVVMTQSFTSTLFVMERLFLEISGINTEFFKEQVELAKNIIENSFKFFENMNLTSIEHVVFLGTGENWGLANEGALKVKEMAITYSESHSTLDYRHGPKALVSEKTVVIIQTEEDEKEFVKNLRKELEEYGAKVVEIGYKKDLDLIKNFGRGKSAPLRIIPVQVFSLILAKLKGKNPDSPRNLTKVVKI
ncbi:MAG: SIS domain-containing protein [Thermotogaceae bacterium]|nr:SIS domain-containing protein [Thermotogaceae bacterium]